MPFARRRMRTARLTHLMRTAQIPAVLGLAFFGVLGCAEQSRLPINADVGPQPTLPEPTTALVPTVKIAPAKGWPDGVRPTPAAGLAVKAFATGFDHPRWLYVLPNGDVLVAETNAPPRPEDGKGIKAAVMKLLMQRVGAATPSANRITLLRDADGDGVAEFRSTLVEGLYSPFGMALVGNRLFIADTDALLSYPYSAGQTRISASATRVADLPGGPLNHHWTKNVIASPDGTMLYVTVGSNSNAAENGIDKEEGRAGIRTPARYGLPSTSATSSEAISCPIT